MSMLMLYSRIYAAYLLLLAEMGINRAKPVLFLGEEPELLGLFEELLTIPVPLISNSVAERSNV